MAVWAVVPVKPFALGKSRLSSVLSMETRHLLNRLLLENTLAVLKNVPQIDNILVVSRDFQALEMAKQVHGCGLMEPESFGLNQAIDYAVGVAGRNNAHCTLVLPADLPFLNTTSIHGLLSEGSEPPMAVIAPDRHRKGTNAIYNSPVRLIKYRFGKNSFQAHLNQASNSGAGVSVYEDKALSMDLDACGDLWMVQQSMKLLEPSYEVQSMLKEMLMSFAVPVNDLVDETTLLKSFGDGGLNGC